MVAATPRPAGTSVPPPWVGWRAAVLCITFLLVPVPGQGQEPPREDGAFISVPAPIDSRAVNGVKASVSRALGQKDRPLTVLVFDFNPGDRSATSNDYGACLNLAEYLLNLQNVNTVAFVHREVTGHLVLPVLACREIVMAREA